MNLKTEFLFQDCQFISLSLLCVCLQHFHPHFKAVAAIHRNAMRLLKNPGIFCGHLQVSPNF